VIRVLRRKISLIILEFRDNSQYVADIIAKSGIIVDRFRALQAFVSVADHRGFSAAATALKTSPAAVTRLIAGLENEIGARLFARSTRKVGLTDQGALFLTHARTILAELAEAEAAISGAALALKGQVRLTAPVLFGRIHVAPLLLDFSRRYPEISIDFLLQDRVVDMAEEAFDLAVRIADPTDGSQSAGAVGSVRRVLCAAPDYLARRGTPHTVKDLERHDGIELSSASARQWVFRLRGVERQARPRLAFSTNSPEVAMAACLSGQGVARFMDYQVRSEIERGQLVPLLAGSELPPVPIHLVQSSRRPLPRRVLLLLEHLLNGLTIGP
jgi:DNA-binding transcriptional LysR family regulator